MRTVQENYHENIRLTEKFRSYAKNIGFKTATLAIAWLLNQGEHIIPIPGTRSVNHLNQLAAARDIDLNDQTCNV